MIHSITAKAYQLSVQPHGNKKSIVANIKGTEHNAVSFPAVKITARLDHLLILLRLDLKNASCKRVHR